MKVVIHREGQYLKAHRAFIQSGGTRKLAADKASRIRTNLEADLSPGVHVTTHGETRIPHAVKYDLGDGLRLVTVQDQGVCLFLYMGNHDDTQRWLDQNRGLRIVANNTSREVNVINDIPDMSPGDMPPPIPTLDTRPYLERVMPDIWPLVITNAAVRTFLMQYGESADEAQEKLLWLMISILRTENEVAAQLVTTVLRHVKLGEYLQAEGAIDEFFDRTSATPEKTPSEVLTDDVLNADANADRLIVLNDLTAAEWERLLDPTKFQEFMVWLHPDQKRVVEEDFQKPAILTGVSGSGKTCVLVHRARRLARLYPEERVLVLTLNQSLSRLIENLVNRLCINGENLRIDVMSFHEFVCRVLSALDLNNILEALSLMNLEDAVSTLRRRQGPTHLDEIFRYKDESDLMQLFTKYLGETDRELRDVADRLQIYVYGQEQGVDLNRYLYEELELVRSAFTGYENAYREYLDYPRIGRCIQFQDKRREAVLEVLRGWEQYQIANGFLDHMGLSQAASVVLAANHGDEFPALFRYRSVLVDEFQDFSTVDMKILCRIPKEKSNGLFLTGDFAQKMFAKELDLGRVNLGVDNRTNRSIRKNYRNSRQILEAAYQLIKHFEPELTPSERGSILDPEYTIRDSAKPIAIHTNNPVGEAWQHAVSWLKAGNIEFSVCLATANQKTYSIASILASRPEGIEASVLTGDYILDPRKVVVTEIANVKGFEFSLILIIGLEAGIFPATGRPEREVWRDAMRLYVAITRGRDEVRFLYQNTPSRFLRAMESFVDWREAEIPQPETIASTRSKEASNVLVEKPQESVNAQRQNNVPPALTIRVINGVPVVDLEPPISQNSLAAALGKPLIQVCLASQAADYYSDGITELPNHIVCKIVEYFNCVPNIIHTRTLEIVGGCHRAL